MYDMKVILYREQNKYNLFKNGIEFIMRAHWMKMNLTIVTTGHMLANASVQDPYLQFTVESKIGPLVDVFSDKKHIYIDGSFSFASIYSVLLFSLLLINGVCLVVSTMNDDVCEFKGMVNLVNNVVLVFIIVVMSHVLVIQA